MLENRTLTHTQTHRTPTGHPPTPTPTQNTFLGGILIDYLAIHNLIFLNNIFFPLIYLFIYFYITATWSHRLNPPVNNEINTHTNTQCGSRAGVDVPFYFITFVVFHY